MTTNAPLRPGQAQAARDAIRRGEVRPSPSFDMVPEIARHVVSMQMRRIELLRTPAAVVPKPDPERWERGEA
jgi:hypothetical protein